MHPNHRDLEDLPQDLHRVGVPGPVRRWIEAAAGSAVRRVRRLAGASSTAVHGIYLDDGARLVLRRYVWRHYVETEPDAPPREIDVLRFARGHGLAAPEVVAADPTGAVIGDGVPALLMTFLPGQPVASPDVRRLAEVAAAIHDVDPGPLGHHYFPWYEGTASGPPAATTRPELWERAMALWRKAEPAYTPRFIHRDFHPGNVLWQRSRATGVVDWVNGCAGPWGCDIAHCRTNLIDWAGQEAADGFLAAYEAATGRTYHPYWEIASVLEHDGEWLDEYGIACEDRLARAVAAMG